MITSKQTLCALAASLAWSLMGCGGPLKYAVHGSPAAPEIDAKIVAQVNKDGNFTTLTVRVEHLAPPTRLGPEGKVFVVWTKGNKPKWHRVGALKYDEGGRTGAIEGVSVPVTAFDLQVTTEKDAVPEAPSADVVLSQHVN